MRQRGRAPARTSTVRRRLRRARSAALRGRSRAPPDRCGTTCTSAPRGAWCAARRARTAARRATSGAAPACIARSTVMIMPGAKVSIDLAGRPASRPRRRPSVGGLATNGPARSVHAPTTSLSRARRSPRPSDRTRCGRSRSAAPRRCGNCRRTVVRGRRPRRRPRPSASAAAARRCACGSSGARPDGSTTTLTSGSPERAHGARLRVRVGPAAQRDDAARLGIELRGRHRREPRARTRVAVVAARRAAARACPRGPCRRPSLRWRCGSRCSPGRARGGCRARCARSSGRPRAGGSATAAAGRDRSAAAGGSCISCQPS